MRVGALAFLERLSACALPLRDVCGIRYTVYGIRYTVYGIRYTVCVFVESYSTEERRAHMLSVERKQRKRWTQKQQSRKGRKDDGQNRQGPKEGETRHQRKKENGESPEVTERDDNEGREERIRVQV